MNLLNIYVNIDEKELLINICCNVDYNEGVE